MYIDLIYERATKLERLFAFSIDMLFLKLVKTAFAIAGLKIGFIPCFLLYFTVMHTISGQTLGKYTLGLRVVTSYGENPSVFQSLIRTVLYPVALMTFYPVHDKISKTAVVRE